YTTQSQILPRVAMDKSGNFVITWFGDPIDGDEDIFAQLYNASGKRQGSEILVNTITTSDQVLPYVAMDGDGDFVIAWSSKYAEEGPGIHIAAQRFEVSN
ncbi:MAG TPA: hypothetical protein V6D23_26355, partial [Candidatus Obscuribacterales bacterium]